jgi:hypothetical protein
MGSNISIHNDVDRTIHVKFANSKEAGIGVSPGLLPFAAAAGAIGGAIAVGAGLAGSAIGGVSLAVSLADQGYHKLDKGESYSQGFT